MTDDTFTERAIAAQETVVAWLRPFIDALMANEGDVDAACETVNITPAELYRVVKTNPPVKVAFERAKETVRELRAGRLETVAFHDAAYGAREYKFTPMGTAIPHPEKPGESYYETKRDNRLVMALLKSLNRPIYGDHAEITGPGGGPIQHAHAVATLADITRISAMLDSGQIKPDEVVGEFQEGEVLDAEVVDEKV